MATSKKTIAGAKPADKPSGAPRWTYVAGALVAAGTLLWAVLKDTAFKKDPAPSPPTVQQSATADGGGAAINATGNATVNVGSPGSAAAPTATASGPGVAASQAAKAASGGVALNATDSAQVKVNKP